ncbi:MAG: M20/M25/M40 family metallo-hydrolase [Patescibacteria group bacterium]|nr:M20/M25/M40 family metallo-hydrolase [Patescibacteria group bacterium]
MENEIIKLTEKLIAFSSVEEDLKAKQSIVNFVEKQFKNEDVFIKKFVHNNIPSIVINLRKEKNPFLFLNGHLDVVSADKNFFKAKVKNKKIYGRGSGDMKAGCAVMIEVIKFFSKQKKKPSIGLMLTTDEEIGGANGVGYLLNEKKYKSQFAVVPDGGKRLNTIVLNQKGVLHFKVRSFGKSSHASMPFLGKNAIDDLINRYIKLRKVIPEIKEGEWKNTMNLGKILGGETINKVPDYAEMFLDIRFTKKEDRKKIFKEVEKIFKEIEIVAEGHPFIQNRNHPLIKLYANIANEELKREVNSIKKEGASDARYFFSKKIPTIITKINCGNIHGENEWVDIAEMKKFYNILVKFISSIFE